MITIVVKNGSVVAVYYTGTFKATLMRDMPVKVLDMDGLELDQLDKQTLEWDELENHAHKLL